jgi:type VI secretion system secreted protein VgrG
MYTQTERILSVATPLGEDAVLMTAFAGSESLSQLFHFELDLAAEQPIDFDKLLGQKIGVSVALAGGNRFFNGIVNRISSGVRDKRFFYYRADAVPQVWVLTRRVRSRIFQRLTVPQILAKVFEGFDVSDQTVGPFPQREYCVQYQESDFAFASRLMEEEGI